MLANILAPILVVCVAALLCFAGPRHDDFPPSGAA